MARTARRKEEEVPAGAPDWMVTFSDCMTLLLTFFVLLLSFATFHEETLPALGQSFAQALPSIGQSRKSESDSIYENERTQNVLKVSKGTETRPPVESINTEMPLSEQKPLDFKNVKVFSIESERFFWGRGNAPTDMGRQVLDALAVFLRSRPSRVVISESGPGDDRLGLERAWTIVQYMNEKHKISRDKFSITASSMMQEPAGQTRMLQITMLERDIYE